MKERKTEGERENWSTMQQKTAVPRAKRAYEPTKPPAKKQQGRVSKSKNRPKYGKSASKRGSNQKVEKKRG